MKPLHSRIRPLILLTIVASVVLAACGTASQPSHITTIGIINYTAGLEPVITGLKANLADAGFVEGKSIAYLYNGPVPNDNTAIDTEIQKLASQNPDLYLTVGSIPSTRIQSVLQKTNKYAVFAPVTNPIGLGVVQDIRKPGGRMTGIDSGGPITSKALEWFLTVVPTVKRVHVFYLHGETLAPPNFPLMQTTADKLKVELVLHEVGSPKDILPIVDTLTVGTDAIFVPVGQLVLVPNGQSFVPIAAKRGIPVGSSIAGAGNGELTGVSIDYTQVGKQAGQLAQQIIHGADAGTLPIEPAQFKVQVDLVTASTLGLTLPDSVLKQADAVVRVVPTPVATAAATSNPSNGTPQATASS